jgi:hypothetical protein
MQCLSIECLTELNRYSVVKKNSEMHYYITNGQHSKNPHRQKLYTVSLTWRGAMRKGTRMTWVIQEDQKKNQALIVILFRIKFHGGESWCPCLQSISIISSMLLNITYYPVAMHVHLTININICGIDCQKRLSWWEWLCRHIKETYSNNILISFHIVPF